LDPRIREILQTQRLCVLATSWQEEPYCSLMGYLWDQDTGDFYMVTSSESRKFRNLNQNPRVSLLLDTRTTEKPRDGASIRALTVQGKAQLFSGPGIGEEVLKRMQQVHPQLRNLLQNQKVVVVRVRPISFLLLDGVENAHFEESD
jgi:nitroimidazol reductase NimA-like FMN-containing flavoprotein (pyridoxamine 5'-phosphate oxidase superfamily)